MTRSIVNLVEDLETRLGRLVSDPVTLLCLLLAANALVQPYRGLDHDSRLYAVQVLERIQPGSFVGDLYLRYGSQDRYSVFTVLIVPLVRICGLHVTFFCVYLASKALFFWGLLRLTRVLISSNLALVLALIHLAIVPVAFGGNEIFHVNESFLTPRLASCALVLLALEHLLAGRNAATVLLLFGSLRTASPDGSRRHLTSRALVVGTPMHPEAVHLACLDSGRSCCPGHWHQAVGQSSVRAYG